MSCRSIFCAMRHEACIARYDAKLTLGAITQTHSLGALFPILPFSGARRLLESASGDAMASTL